MPSNDDHQATDPQEIAFKFAVEKINADNKILPRSKLHAEIERILPQDSFHASKRVCHLMNTASLFFRNEGRKLLVKFKINLIGSSSNIWSTIISHGISCSKYLRYNGGEFYIIDNLKSSLLSITNICSDRFLI